MSRGNCESFNTEENGTENEAEHLVVDDSNEGSVQADISDDEEDLGRDFIHRKFEALTKQCQTVDLERVTGEYKLKCGLYEHKNKSLEQKKLVF